MAELDGRRQHVPRLTRLARALAPPAPGRATQLRQRISARRAYTEVLGVYALTLGTAVGSAFVLLDDHDALVDYRIPAPGREVAGELLNWSVVLPGLALAWWLARRRGWTWRRLGLGPRWVSGRTARRQGIAIGATLFASQIVAAVVLTALASGARFPSGGTGPWGMIGGTSGAVRSAFVEELIVTAFTITTLRQARRPWPEVLTVTLVLRAAYHVYYGTWWVLLWVAIWSGTAFLLYARTRRLTPLVVGHGLWDLQGFTIIELGHVGDQIVLATWLLALCGGFVLLATRTTRSALLAGQTGLP